MTVRVFTDIDALPPEYDALFDAAGRRSLFAGLDWFRLLAATTLADGQSARLYGLEPEGGGAPRAALVASDADSGARTRTVSAFTNFYSMTYAPVVAPGEAPEAAIETLIGGICRERPRWDRIAFAPMTRTDGAFDQVAAALRRAGMMTTPYFAFGNWFEPIAEASFDAYLASRPSRLRNTYRRRSRKLESESAVRYELFTDASGIEAALSAYQTIYERSWKQPEHFQDFIPGLIKLAARRGWLRLGVIHIDGIPAAAQLWLLDGDRAVIYKLTHDDRFRSLSIGTVLTMYLMRHVIEVDMVREVDFGSGDDPYKKDWMSSRRERWGVVGYNPATARGLARGLAERAAGWIRARRAGSSADGSQTDIHGS